MTTEVERHTTLAGLFTWVLRADGTLITVTRTLLMFQGEAASISLAQCI